MKRILLLLLCLSLFLTGCLLSGDSPSDPVSSERTETVPETPAEETAAAPETSEQAVPETAAPGTTEETGPEPAALTEPETTASVPETTVPEPETTAPIPETAAPIPETTAPEPDQTIVFRFAGDFTQAEKWTADGYAPIMQTFDDRYGGDITKVFDEELLALMKDADIFMLNNEFVYTDSKTPRRGKKYTYKASFDRVKNLSILGVDIVGLANNHAFDWEEESLLDTLDTLEAEGIPYVGAGRDLKEAARVQYFTIGGRTFSIVAATSIEHYGGDNYRQTEHAGENQPGVFYTTSSNKALLQSCQEVIREAKANSDYCFMYIHWGIEKTTEIEDEQKTLAKAFIDAGADAVIGAHPHVLQGFDYYNGKPILYSLGNYWFNAKDLDSCLLEFTFHTRDFENVQIRFIPCHQKNCRTTLVSDTAEYSSALKRMRRISFHAELDENGILSCPD